MIDGTSAYAGALISNMSNHNHFRDGPAQLGSQGRALREMIPDIYRGFSEMDRAAMASNTLDKKHKALLAMPIGVAPRCDGCIAAHARRAVAAGASKQEAVEAIGVSVLMQGGPATVYGARVPRIRRR